MLSATTSLSQLLIISMSLSVAVVLLVAAYTAYRPVVRRLGVRQTFRRPSRTITTLMGLVLSVAIITASLGLGDSLNASAVAGHLRQVGTVDESVSGTFSAEQITRILAALRTDSAVRSADPLYMGQVQARSTFAANSLTEYGVPADFDSVYGTSQDSGGRPLSFKSMPSDSVIVSATAAQLLGVARGDTLRLSSGNTTTTFTIYGVLNHDIALTTGEVAANLSFPEVILPLSTAQYLYQQTYHYSLVPNVIAVRNTGTSAIANAPSSQQVLHVLQQLLGVTPLDPYAAHATHYPTPFDTVIIHPLNPSVVADTAGISIVSNKGELIGSPAARQFFLLFPIFTYLLVGAGMLLLVLLNLLQVEEQRTELGITRAIGLQRRDLIGSLLLESCCYMGVALPIGLFFGIALVGAELRLLSALPHVGLQLSGAQASLLDLSLSVRWESLLFAANLSFLTVCAVVTGIAWWVSRTKIVVMLRDLTPSSLEAIPKSIYRRLVLFLKLSGAMWLMPASIAAWLAWFNTRTMLWREIGLLLSLLLVARILVQAVWLAWVQQLIRIVTGIGWIAIGLQFGMAQFIVAFAANVVASGQNYISPDILGTLISLSAIVVGGVFVTIGSMGQVAVLLRLVLQRLRWLRPVVRTGLVYSLSYRARTMLILMLLGLVTFLTMTIIINNLSNAEQSLASLTTGGYQLEIDVPPLLHEQLGQSLAQTPKTLPHSIAAVATATPAYDLLANRFMLMRLELPGNHIYNAPGPTVADNNYLATTTMPMFARARGYATSHAVWQAIQGDHSYGALQYQGGLGLPSQNNFNPFTIDISPSGSATPYKITIIGIVPSNTYWPTVFLSRASAETVHLPTNEYPTAYYFAVAQGTTTEAAAHSLGQTFHLGDYGLSPASIDAHTQGSYTQTLTLFLAAYLALGLCFGALSIGIITNRNVVERRQQIGMLRALGFSRWQVLSLFLVESGFVATLALLMGLGLAWWLVLQVNQAFSKYIPFPTWPVVILFVSTYAVIFVCIWLPARRAARIPPAEALRYE